MKAAPDNRKKRGVSKCVSTIGLALLLVSGTISSSRAATSADLAVQSVDATAGTYSPGDTIRVYNLIKNIGDQVSSSYTVDFYASLNTTITSSDHPLGSTTRSGLSAQATHSYDSTCTFPSNIPPGNYYIGMIVTCVGVGNNTGYDSSRVTVQVPPSVDLTLHRVSDTSGSANSANPGSAKSTFSRGETVRITLAANNSGGGTGVVSVLNIRGPDNATLAYDSHLASQDNSTDSPLSTGETDYYSFNWTIPTNAQLGYYDLAASIRNFDNWAEVFDTTGPGRGIVNWDTPWINNQFEVVAKPDLIVNSGPNLDRNEATRGFGLNVSGVTVKNQGSGDAASCSLGYYLSTSSAGTDTYLSSIGIEALGHGATSSTKTNSLTIPSGTPASDNGTSYFLVVNADRTNIVEETSEKNNTASSSIVVYTPPVTAESADKTSIAMSEGETATITITVQNTGGKSPSGSPSVSVSSGLEIIQIDGIAITPTQFEDVQQGAVRYYSVPIGDTAHRLNTAGGGTITAVNQLVEAYREYRHGDSQNHVVVVRAKSTGPQWIKHRAALSNLQNDYWEYRSPASGGADQQGWPVHTIDVTVTNTMSVSGIVRSSQWPYDPIGGVEISDGTQNTSSSTDPATLGQYTLTDVTAGTITLTASKTDYYATNSNGDTASQTFLATVDATARNFLEFRCEASPQVAISGVPATVTVGDSFNVTVTMTNTSNAVNGPYAYLDLSFDSSLVQVGTPTGPSGVWSEIQQAGPGSGNNNLVYRAPLVIGEPWTQITPTERLISAKRTQAIPDNSPLSFTVPITATGSGTLVLKYRGTIGDRRDPVCNLSGSPRDQQNLNGVHSRKMVIMRTS